MHSFTVLLSLGSLYCKFKPQGINLPLTQSWRRHLHVAFFLSFTLSLSLSLSLSIFEAAKHWNLFSILFSMAQPNSLKTFSLPENIFL